MESYVSAKQAPVEFYARDAAYSIKSQVPLLQVFSDKSQVNVKPTSFNFYSVDIKLPNLIDEARRDLIIF